jgi:hypothetical protein
MKYPMQTIDHSRQYFDIFMVNSEAEIATLILPVDLCTAVADMERRLGRSLISLNCRICYSQYSWDMECFNALFQNFLRPYLIHQNDL